VNVLPLRVDLAGDPSWSALLERVREAALEAYDHQDVPFERLVEELQPRRDLGRAALRQAGIALQEVPDRPIVLRGDVTAYPLALDPGVSRLDLTLFLRPGEGGRLAGALEYATDLFDRATAARLAEGFVEALTAFTEDRPWQGSRSARAVRQAAAPETNLTEAQLLFWFAHRLNPDVQLYFDRASTVFTLDGDLDPEAFRQAFARLLETCDVLRSQVREVFGVPWRSIGDGLEPLEILDLSGPPDPEGTFRRWLARRSRQPMDLADRLWDSALVRTGPSRWCWFLSIHHLIVDAWTLQLLARRMSHLYREASEAPAFPSFETYALAEREARGSERYRRARDYWERKLARPAAENPFYRRTGAERSTSTERLSTELDSATSGRIRTLASRLGLFSPSIVFATALFALLHRLSGERRLRLGTPFANRPDRFRDTPGLMMNAAPLEVREGDTATDLSFASFTALAHAVQREVVETARHQLYPVRNPAEGRAWDVYLNFQTVSFPELCGLPARFELLHSGHSPDHLSVQVSDFDATGRYRLDADFQQACFDAAERERTLGHLLTLLGALLEDPEIPLRDAPLLSPAERLQLAAFNATDEPFPRGLCLHHLIEAQIARTPSAVAVSSEEAEEAELTYRELGDRARRLAAFLRAAGVRPDDRVGVCLERSLELSVALLGILEAGAAYVPIDPGYPAERIAFLIEDAAVPVLLTQSRLSGALPEIPSATRVVRLDAERATIASFSPDPATDLGETGLAYTIYTSGSTGRPKGAMVPHAGIVNRLLWMQRAYGLTPADRVLQKTPYSFDVSVWELFWPLIVGARLVMARPGGHRDPAYLAATIARERITTVHFVPSMLQAFLDQPALGPFPSLARVLCSGEALSETLRVRFHERLSAPASTELHNLYGPTEASVDVTAWASDPRARLPFVPIGRPISNVRLDVLDRDGGPVPPGIPGELCIAGVALARGYHLRPALTAERFVPDPFATEPGGRLYRTGDLARWTPNGDLEFLGRIDHQVKIRGFRVELEEIETALAGLPGVREAVVTMREDRPGDRHLIAYVVPEIDSTPPPAALRAELQEKLPDFMVPSAFVELPSIPLTPSGKADRAALPRPEAEALPTDGDAAQIQRPPRTPLEWLIAEVCAEVLGVQSVPVDADFFALGGNSLLATQVVTMLQEVLPIELDLRQVFEGPTVARLAATIEEGRSALGEPERRAMTEILAELGESLSSGGADPGSPG
jgi:amino acid adenylation domain-containing protein